MRFAPWSRALFALGLAVATAACPPTIPHQKEPLPPDPTEDIPEPEPPERYEVDGQNALVRMVNFTDGIGAIDVILNNSGVVAIANLGRTRTSPRVAYPPGTYMVDYMTTGSTTIWATVNLTATAGEANTIVAHGTVQGIDHGLTYSALILVDDVTKPPSGMARIRPVNLTIAQGSGAILDVTSTQQQWSLGYGTAGNAAIVAAGTHTWEIDWNGDTKLDASIDIAVADGDTANVFLLSTMATSGAPVPVGAAMLGHTTSPAAADPGSYFDANGAIQPIALPVSIP